MATTPIGEPRVDILVPDPAGVVSENRDQILLPHLRNG